MSTLVLKGVVVANVCDKTVAVLVSSQSLHKRYKRIVKSKKKYLAHDESNQCKIGADVVIKLSRPISSRKKFIVVKVNKV